MAKKREERGPMGNCFQFAYEAFFFCPPIGEKEGYASKTLKAAGFRPSRITLVHGTVTGEPNTPVAGERFTHAWLETMIDHEWFIIDCGSIKCQFKVYVRDEYNQYHKVEECQRYTVRQAALNVGKIGTYGPWDKKQIADLEAMKAKALRGK